MPATIFKRIFNTSLFIVFVITLSFCQTNSFTIEGNIVDEKNESIMVGDVILYKNDTIAYHSPIINGDYRIDQIEPGSYYLRVSCLGYKEVEDSLMIKESRILNYILKEDAELLNEVTVVAMRESIQYEHGNVKVNMANSIFSQQASTLDAIGMMPGVISDPINQTVSIIGSGSPLLYIGNRNITMEELIAIPVSNIKKVELIRNPSAKYEATGGSVILITLYKRLDDGIHLELTENIVKRRNWNNYAGVNTALRLNKLEIKSNFGYNTLNTWEGIETKIDLPVQDISTKFDAISQGDRPQYVAGAGVYYQLNKDDYISINGILRKHTTVAPLMSNSMTIFSDRTENVISLSEDNENRGFYTANINYNNGFEKTGSNLFLGLQTSRYQRGLLSDVSTGMNNTSLVLDQSREQDYKINVLAARVDFEQKLGGGETIEAGLNIYSGVADAFQEFTFQDPKNIVVSNYDYKESNIAVYGQIVGEAMGLQYTVGLRTESTDFYGKFVNDPLPIIERKQTNLFPRVNLSYQIDSLSNINLNFSSSIQRPNYLNATSITTYITPYVEYQRNANLVPSTARFLSANYQRGRQSLYVAVYTRDNLVQQSVRYDEGSKRIINSPENFELERGVNIRLSNYLTFKKWTVNTVAMASINQLKDSTGVAQDVTPFLYFYVNNRFVLPHGFALGINGFAISSRNSGVFKRNGRISIGASLSKSIKNFTFSLNANDIFRGMNFREEYTVNNISSNTYQIGDMKSLSLSVRYKIGKQFKSKYQNRDVDENLDRMR